jgi:ATP-dependent helicase HrpB
MRQHYPIDSAISPVVTALRDHPIVILVAPPGAGKSTVLPLALLNERFLREQKIVMLEPRRLAARTVAARMSQLLGESPGGTIGYRIRFETAVSKNTRCEVITEGILTRMIQADNSLQGVGLVIFDEFHERSLYADLALSLCLQVQQVLRSDLRILIMSATLDVDKLSSQLNAPVINCAGKQYPVEMRYLSTERSDPIPLSVAKVIRKAFHEQPGDILAFLPGTADIRKTYGLLEDEELPALIFPLYGELPFAQQQAAILPDRNGTRKIVLATSIAETSLTIEGINTVIDSGYARIPRFDPRSGMTRLQTVQVTRDAADQRAGRAGRLGPGTCYRLWTDATHRLLLPARQPEILESDLSSLVLELASWGIADINDLTWVTPPPSGAVSQAKELLSSLEALDGGRITPKGREMIKLPTHPRLAHMMLSNRELIGLAIDVAVLLEERDPLSKTSGTDLSLRVDALRAWRRHGQSAGDRATLERIERSTIAWRKIFGLAQQTDTIVDTQVGMLLMEAYPERIARRTDRQSGRYKLVNGRAARLPDHDPLSLHEWIAIAQLDSGTTEGRVFSAAPLTQDELQAKTTAHTVVKWDDDREMITASIEHRIGSVIFSTQTVKDIAEEMRLNAVCGAIREKGMSLLPWNDEHTAWQSRVLSLRQWRPEESWPDVREETLLEQVDQWLAPFLTHVAKRRDLQSIDLTHALHSILPWELARKLDQLTPVRVTVPSGSAIRLRYSKNGEPPILEVRLQEVFGLLDTPKVNDGRTSVLMHLLSPGFKPVQITQDLRSFWQSGYHEVRKQLRQRYPRHHWPEDPWTAQAIRGARKRKP